MSFSDSDGPIPVTPVINQEYEDVLRKVTQEGLNRGTFTVNKARAAAEEELGLEAGFFKSDTWKEKSKEVIQIAVEDPTTKPDAIAARIKAAAKAGTKRKSEEAPAKKQQPRKKARKSTSEEESSEPEIDDEESEAESTPSEDDDISDAKPAKKKMPAKRKPAQKKSKAVSDDDESDAKPKKKAPVKRKAAKKAAEKVVEDSEASDPDSKFTSPAPVVETTEKSIKSEERDVKEESTLSDPPTEIRADKAPAAEDDDDSDMSVLIDEPPKKKRGGKKAAAEPKTKTKPIKAKNKDLSPDEEEIKRLQGWLVKCGIRKMWHNELKKYDSPKPKIKHLKKMLEDAGMTGRYSNEKAKDIKEARELAMELEETQEYAKKWGQDKDKDDEESGEDEQVSEEELKPVKRKPKGLVDFGDSGDDGSD